MRNIMNYLYFSNFVQHWFRIDTKIMLDFLQKKSQFAKPGNCCAREPNHMFQLGKERLYLLWVN